ncbi:hypothetical protein [Myroides sp.]|uniref:hypothetical protein n=1 Tax=Myroides sp. TaxID=1874736 RepID=UPI003F31C777
MIQYILNNNEALIEFINNRFPNIDQVKRTVLLELRKHNVKAPDHLYRLQMEDKKDCFKSFSDLFIKGIGGLSASFFENRNNQYFILKEEFFKWQEVITLIPPSVLIASKISQECINDKMSIWKDYILPNTYHTMLLSPHIIQLENKVNEWKGLDELHIHLNGSLEVDKVWQDYLKHPEKIKAYLEKVRVDKPLEQFSQEGFLLSPQSIFDYLCIAKSLRQYFYVYLDKRNGGKLCKNDGKDNLPFYQEFTNKDHLLSKIIAYGKENWSKYDSPFDTIIEGVEIKKEQYPSLECFMIVLLFKELQKNKDGVLAELLYFYLLIYGLINRLLSHQLHQNGFEQFQKITLNELREFSEEKFDRRFKQFAGNDLSYLRFIEGRISPKKTMEKWHSFLKAILNGWNKFQKVSKGDSDIRLIIHFIKRTDNNKNDAVRYYEVRKGLYEQGHLIRGLLNETPKYRELLSGIDAASSEFDSPPEIFGPVFRMMRNTGFKYFTYHAGEDFYHIFTGMRAIYEAILFCNLTYGDRIGHAVALGLDPVQWGNVIGKKIKMRQGEYLDDLAFLFYVIKEYKIEAFYSLLNLIKSRAEHLYFEVYDKYLPIETIVEGWKLRGVCPIHFKFNSDDVNVILVESEEESQLVKDTEKKYSESVIDVYKQYHIKKNRDNYNKKIEIQIEEFIKLDEIHIIQKALLEMMNKKEIVIETLPMSNVRIGFHQDFSTYHLWNWIKWKKEGVGVPPIIIGSDDTGIFATNIYNEYANVYLMLVQYYNLSHTEAMKVLEEFKQNGDVYRFKS